jgi:hypothetical protein
MLRKLRGSDGDGDAKGKDLRTHFPPFSFPTAVNLELTGVEGAVKWRPTGTISVRLMRSAQAASLAVDQAQKAAENVATTSALMVTGGSDMQSVAAVSQLDSALASITSKLHIIVCIGDKLATVCSPGRASPYPNLFYRSILMPTSRGKS